MGMKKKACPIINSKMMCNDYPVYIYIYIYTGYFVMTSPMMVYTDNDDISRETKLVNNKWVRTQIVRNIVFSGHKN